MATQNNNPITYFESALLANDVYKENAENRGINGWNTIDGGSADFDSGLSLDTYQNATHPNQVVIAIAGTNGLDDWDDSVSFLTGGLSEQFQQALTHVAQTIDTSVKNSEGTGQSDIFSVTGHSLGGGIAQVIAHTFGLNGVALEAPGAGVIVADNDYQTFVTSLKENYPDAFTSVADTPSTGEGFINISEQGSFVSSIGAHLGTEVKVDAVSDVKTAIGKLLLSTKVTSVLGLALIVDGQKDNHSLDPAIEYIEQNQEAIQQQAKQIQLDNFEPKLTQAEKLHTQQHADETLGALDEIKQNLEAKVYDAEGYDQWGYDGDGYNAEGYDVYGYDEMGIDGSGVSKSSYDFDVAWGDNQDNGGGSGGGSGSDNTQTQAHYQQWLANKQAWQSERNTWQAQYDTWQGEKDTWQTEYDAWKADLSNSQLIPITGGFYFYLFIPLETPIVEYSLDGGKTFKTLDYLNPDLSLIGYKNQYPVVSSGDINTKVFLEPDTTYHKGDVQFKTYDHHGRLIFSHQDGNNWGSGFPEQFTTNKFILHLASDTGVSNADRKTADGSILVDAAADTIWEYSTNGGANWHSGGVGNGSFQVPPKFYYGSSDILVREIGDSSNIFPLGHALQVFTPEDDQWSAAEQTVDRVAEWKAAHSYVFEKWKNNGFMKSLTI